MIVLLVWVVAMLSALFWPRRVTALCTALVVMMDVAVAGVPTDQAGWLQAIVLGLTPWLLTAQRIRHGQRLSALREEETDQAQRLSEAARASLALQQSAGQVESQITEITDVYRVTKETARAMHLNELFHACLTIAPRLLDVRGLRLIDCSTEPPAVLRATRAADGRLISSAGTTGEHAALLDVETELVRLATAAKRPEGLAAQTHAGPWPDGPARAAWVPLWQEQRPIGVLVADDVPATQLKTLELIGHQLSLQMVRIVLYRRVEALAVTDALTSVSVRRYFLERAREELARAKRQGTSGTLLMVDLDLFKEKNDTYGHLVGDVVLRDVAQLLQRNLREIDLIARYGGEEFILLLTDTDVEHGFVIAQRLRQLVEVHPIRAYDELLTQTISIGVAGFPDDAGRLELLIERADHALYAAKHAGRNRAARFTEARG